MKLLEQEIEVKQAEPGKGCPGGITHTFDDDLTLLTFCACNQWQIWDVQSTNVIDCVDIAGRRQLFDRD